MSEAVVQGMASGRYTVWWKGETLPVTHLYRLSAEVATLDEAFAFVAGPMSDGSWLAGAVAEFELREVAPQ